MPHRARGVISVRCTRGSKRRAADGPSPASLRGSAVTRHVALRVAATRLERAAPVAKRDLLRSAVADAHVLLAVLPTVCRGAGAVTADHAEWRHRTCTTRNRGDRLQSGQFVLPAAVTRGLATRARCVAPLAFVRSATTGKHFVPGPARHRWHHRISTSFGKSSPASSNGHRGSFGAISMAIRTHSVRLARPSGLIRYD